MLKNNDMIRRKDLFREQQQLWTSIRILEREIWKLKNPAKFKRGDLVDRLNNSTNIYTPSSSGEIIEILDVNDCRIRGNTYNTNWYSVLWKDYGLTSVESEGGLKLNK
jgi:hypothetical protein